MFREESIDLFAVLVVVTHRLKIFLMASITCDNSLDTSFCLSEGVR